MKNNAQATTSFLSLQASRASDAAVAAALRGAAMRVMLATLVQDRMFRVPPRPGSTWGRNWRRRRRPRWRSWRARPELDLQLEDRLILPVAQATPLALIVNELVVNAARHAFPAGGPGTITPGGAPGRAGAGRGRGGG